MKDVSNQVAIVLKNGNAFTVKVKDGIEASKVIDLLYEHRGKLLLETSMESCPTLLNCDDIAKAVYTSTSPHSLQVLVKGTLTEDGKQNNKKGVSDES